MFSVYTLHASYQTVVNVFRGNTRISVDVRALSRRKGISLIIICEKRGQRENGDRRICVYVLNVGYGVCDVRMREDKLIRSDLGFGVDRKTIKVLQASHHLFGRRRSYYGG